MAVTEFITFKLPGEQYGAEFNPETDRLLTETETEELGKRWKNITGTTRPQGWRTQFEGAVLAKREYNGYNDSDFYVLAWNGETVVRYEYATTRSWTYLNGAKVDATPEVLAQVAEWVEAQRAKAVKVAEFVEATEIRKGVEVEVVKGRKTPKGTRGVVFWRGEDQWKSSRWATFYRLGIETEAGEKIWISEDNVARVGAPTEEPAWPALQWQTVAAAVRTLQKEAVAA